MRPLSKAQPTAIDWAAYCALPVNKQLVWEQKANELNEAMLFLMNSKNETAKKDLSLAYFQGNSTTYPINIEAMARYLSTQYSNNKLVNQRGGKKGNKKKGDELKPEDKDSITGNTAGAHVENTTTTKESTPPKGTPNIGAHVSETNIQSSNASCTVKEILDAHPVDDDDFCGNTIPTDVSIDTANSEEMMAGSHVIEFHTSKQRELVTTKLLNKASNVSGLTLQYGVGGGHRNQSNRRSVKPTDYKLNITHEDDSFSSNTVGKEDVAKVIGKTLIIVEGFVNVILPKSSRLKAPTIMEDNKETTNRNESGDLDPITIDDKDNNSVERANTVLKFNNIPGAHVMEEKEEWFYQCVNNYDI